MTDAVVERCPNCGVEHPPTHEGPCEVCGHALRFWCQRHGQEAGWLDGVDCPLCVREAAAREAAARKPPPPPPRRVPVEPRPRARTAARPTARRPAGPPRRRDRGAVLREGAGEILPHVATGAGVAFRVVRALFVVVRTVILWALLGAMGGAAYAFLVGGELVWLALFGLSTGGGIGLFFGIILALRTLFARRPPS